MSTLRYANVTQEIGMVQLGHIHVVTGVQWWDVALVLLHEGEGIIGKRLEK